MPTGPMASVETTTIRVRRATHERLQKQAEATGQSVTQVLEEAATPSTPQRTWRSAARAGFLIGLGRTKF